MDELKEYKMEVQIKVDNGTPVNGMVISFICGCLQIPCKFNTTMDYHRPITLFIQGPLKEIRSNQKILRRLQRGKPKFTILGIHIYELEQHSDRLDYWRYFESHYDR